AADVFSGRGASAEGGNGCGVATSAVGQDIHSQGLAEYDHPRTDLPGAEYAERLAKELGQEIARPTSAAHFPVDPRNAPGRGQHERQRVLGDGESVDPGRVADRDPVTARRVEVDVVGAGAPDRDHLELSARLHHPIGEAGVSPDVDGDAGGVNTFDKLGLVVGTPSGVELHVAALA